MDIRHAINLVDAPLDEERPAPGTRVLMITGKIARAGLERVMKAIDPKDFTYEVRHLDVQVAAWISAEMIASDLTDVDADMILVPGKTTGDVEALSEVFGIPVVRGPECYSELPIFFEEQGMESIDDDDILRPHCCVIGTDAHRGAVAAFLASTYQIPRIERDVLLAAARAENDARSAVLAQYDDPPHNLMAELVRSRFIDKDVRRGFVLDGYPKTPRDIQWLVDMKIGVDMFVVIDDGSEETAALLAALEGNARLIAVPPGDERTVTGTVLERVEQMMQQCLTPDQGLARNK